MAIPKARVRYERPEVIHGKTYKIKPPVMEEAVYITINDAEFDGQLRPVEIFICTKDMRNLQGIDVLTRMMSEVLQQPGPFPEFIISALKESFDVQGGYFLPGGKRANSVYGHIGFVFEDHCKALGLIKEKKK